jgi:aminoglycoside phosphotransferase (APT) family kinase protein
MQSAVLESYLRERMGDVRIDRIVRSFPGFSRETWLVWFSGGDGTDGVVVRADPPGGSITPTPLEREWRLYETLCRTEIPVADALWYDSDPAPTEGRPLFVRKLVDGSTYLPGLHDQTAEAALRRRRVAEEHAEKLAMLHKMDWRAAGFGAFLSIPESPQEAIRHEVQTWADIWTEVKTEPFPVVTEALGWFEANLPPAGGAALSLCKGQNGIGEEIWRNDRIVAFSDWELASIGDPGSDWALTQGMLDLWDRKAILAHYQSITGFSIPPENFAFYRVWDIFKSLCVLNAGLRAFLNGKNTTLARATLGFGKVKVFEHLLGQVIEMDLEQAANLVLNWRKNPYHDARVSGG